MWEELDDDLKYSEIAYPSQEVLDKAEVFNTLPDDINAAMDAQWSEMKSYEEGGNGWMVVVMLVVAIAISTFNIWRKLRKKSRDNYGFLKALCLFGRAFCFLCIFVLY